MKVSSRRKDKFIVGEHTLHFPAPRSLSHRGVYPFPLGPAPYVGVPAMVRQHFAIIFAIRMLKLAFAVTYFLELTVAPSQATTFTTPLFLHFVKHISRFNSCRTRIAISKRAAPVAVNQRRRRGGGLVLIPPLKFMSRRY